MSSSLVVSKIRVNTRINTLSCGLQRSSAQRLVKLDEIDSIQISLLPRTHALPQSFRTANDELQI